MRLQSSHFSDLSRFKIVATGNKLFLNFPSDMNSLGADKSTSSSQSHRETMNRFAASAILGTKSVPQSQYHIFKRYNEKSSFF